MADHLRIIRALQRISDTSRKFTSTTSTGRATPDIPTILKSLPEHKPLLPLLLSHGIPTKLANACADRYDRYASQLRLETEAKLAPYLVNLRRSSPRKVYSAFLHNYGKELRNWAQTVLNTTLNKLNRDSVELRNWDATYPAPLWLPTTPVSSKFIPTRPKVSCPISAARAPSHAFPTTYPPPLRPPYEFLPITWPRTPATSLDSSSTSAIGIDLLCLRFEKSLVIDENPTHPPQLKASIFSLPTALMEDCSRSKHSKRKSPKLQHRHALPIPNPTPTASSLEIKKSRRLSVLPYPSSHVNPTIRKTSAPSRVLTPKRASVSQKTSHPTPHTIPSPLSSLNAPTPNGLGIYSYPFSSTPLLNPLCSLDLATEKNNTPHSLPSSLTGPNTPPPLSSNPSSEPVIAPSTPVRLSPTSSLASITDPFIQFQLQSNYFLSTSLFSSFNCSRPIPSLVTGESFFKSAFSMPFGADKIYNDTPPPGTSDAFENSFLSAYPVF